MLLRHPKQLSGASLRFLSQSATAKVPLRLMPLGGSITYGQGSKDGNGYRNDLRQMLIADGYSVDMVGSHKAGTMQDNDNEGWPKYVVDHIAEKARASVPKYLPNLITVNAGTNDCVDNIDIDHIGTRMETMLKQIWKASTGSTIILSSLLINQVATTESRVLRANEQYQALAQKLLNQEHQKIVFVDMHGPDGPQPKDGDYFDNTHPNEAGYVKMARIWHKGILEAASKGFLSAPHPLPTTS